MLSQERHPDPIRAHDSEMWSAYWGAGECFRISAGLDTFGPPESDS